MKFIVERADLVYHKDAAPSKTFHIKFREMGEEQIFPERIIDGKVFKEIRIKGHKRVHDLILSADHQCDLIGTLKPGDVVELKKV